jgi:hypothetical protein
MLPHHAKYTFCQFSAGRTGGVIAVSDNQSSDVWLMQVHRRSDSPDAQVDHFDKD